MVRTIAVLALMMLFAPADTLDLFGVSEEWEVGLVRWAGLFLVGQAALLRRMVRRRIRDEGWGRIVFVGTAVAALGLLYLVFSTPLLLFLCSIGVIGITVRTLMPVLEDWSIDVRTRLEGG